MIKTVVRCRKLNMAKKRKFNDEVVEVGCVC